MFRYEFASKIYCLDVLCTSGTSLDVHDYIGEDTAGFREEEFVHETAQNRQHRPNAHNEVVWNVYPH